MAGLWTLKQLGGTAVVQDPEEALFPGMPLDALRAVEVDYRLPIADMPGVLAQLARADAHPRPDVPPASGRDKDGRSAKEAVPSED